MPVEAGARYCDAHPISLFSGRWVRSDSKLDNWEAYMESYGMDYVKARLEVIEPQLHIVTSASTDEITIIHQLPWRAGAQVQYTLPIDGQQYPIDARLYNTARSSWQVNDKATWAHSWDEKGLKTEQSLLGGKRMLRYWRSFTTVNEIMINVHLSDVLEDGGEKEIIHTIRYFHRMPFKDRYLACAAQFFSGFDVQENVATCISWMRKAKAKGAYLIVLPENSNRDRAYFKDGKPDREMCWEHAETLEGGFVTSLQRAALDLNMWVVVGVDLRAQEKPNVNIAQLLIRPDGEIEGVHMKHVLWDYEYTLFVPGEAPYQVFDTELGRLGMLVCADGIVPECARVEALMGAQVLVNSLNSRGPDELRVHIPLRAIENGVWHVASNAVGNPHQEGLLWPWTGGSEICDPSGHRVVASEVGDDMVIGEVRPWESELKRASWTDDLLAHRRPELYGILTKPLGELPCAPMYGPAPETLPWEGPEVVRAAMMQFSFVHTREATMWMTLRQVAYAKKRGAVVGVLPELWCFERDQVARDPKAAAEYSQEVLAKLLASAQEHGIHLCFSLVEAEGEKLFHSAYLIGPQGLVAKYRKAHLNSSERAWASAGDSLAEVVQSPLGRVALMIGDEVWIPEVSRCLALEGVELVLHPADWDRVEAAEMAATERGGENRFHLVSVSRLDSPGKVGSQTTLAGEYLGGEPIPLMRYAQGVWARYGVEEQVHVELPRRQAHCKMMGDHLDVLEKRFPDLYEVCTVPTEELFVWKYISDARPGTFVDEHRYVRGTVGVRRKYHILDTPPPA